MTADTPPMQAASSLPPAPRGTSCASRRCSSGSSILAAISNATLPKTPASTAVGAWDASTLPSAAPSTTATPQLLASSQSTAPRAWWLRAELMDVGMMAASEVATATCMRYSSGTPAKRRAYSSTGTVTMPPPTPSMPATKPASTPDTASTATSDSSSVMPSR
jgi:hypothetical protein